MPVMAALDDMANLGGPHLDRTAVTDVWLAAHLKLRGKPNILICMATTAITDAGMNSLKSSSQPAPSLPLANQGHARHRPGLRRCHDRQTKNRTLAKRHRSPANPHQKPGRRGGAKHPANHHTPRHSNHARNPGQPAAVAPAATPPKCLPYANQHQMPHHRKTHRPHQDCTIMAKPSRSAAISVWPNSRKIPKPC